MKRAASIPAVVEQSYELWLWLDTHVVNLPAHARAAIGARALDTALDLLDALLVATYAKRASDEHAAALRAASRRTALLRYLLRGLRDRHHLSLDQHAFAAARIEAVGRAIGAWMSAAP